MCKKSEKDIFDKVNIHFFLENCDKKVNLKDFELVTVVRRYVLKILIQLYSAVERSELVLKKGGVSAYFACYALYLFYES